jgi:N-methylhydantoinase A
MRYAGQGWDIPVPLADDNFDAASAEMIAASFEKEYERFFGRAIEGLDIEIVSWSVKASSPLPPVDRVAAVDEGSVVAPAKTHRLFEASQGAFLNAGIHERDGLKPGDVVKGPAIVVERETSTMLTAAFKAIVQSDGCLLVTRL